MSGKLWLYERLDGTNTGAEATFKVERLYEQGMPFMTDRGWHNNPADSGERRDNAVRAYGYGLRNVHVERQVSTLGDRQSETRYDARDDYGNPTTITESFRGGGEPELSREINRTYDNGLRDGQPGWGTHRWTVSLLTQEIVESGEAQPYKKHWRHDRHGRLVETNENMSRRVIDYGGDGVDNPRSDPVSVTDGLGHRTLLSQYKHGIPERTTYPNGGVSTVSVDDLGNVTAERDPSGITIARGFGQTFGRLGREAPGGGLAGTTYRAALWHDAADPARRRIATAEVDGLATRYIHHDVLGRVVFTRTDPVAGNGAKRHRRVQRNLVGQVIRVSDVAESVPSDLFADAFKGTIYTYDTLGRVLTERHSADDSDSGGVRYCYGGDCDGHPDPAFAQAAGHVRHGYARVDQYNNWTVRNFRAFGDFAAPELVELVEWVGTNARSDADAGQIVRTEIQRNKIGFVTLIAQGNAESATGMVERRFTPYSHGETTTTLLSSETQPRFKVDGAGLTRTILARDAGGRPITERRFDGSELMRMYDAMGRLTSVGSLTPTAGVPEAESVTFDYHPNGALRQAQTGGGTTTWEYAYDAAGSLESETLTAAPDDGSANLVFAIGYVNGPDGLPARLTYPSGRAIDLSRDAYGQVTGIPGYVSAATYHPSGALATYALANGTRFSMTEDARQRPDEWDVTSEVVGELPILDMKYHYNLKGHVQRIDGYFPGEIDPADRNLTGVRYDGIGRLWSAEGPWGTAWYSYSNTGDIVARGIENWSMTYQYDNEKLTGTASAQRPDLSRPVVHDGNGNVTGALGGTFSFDQANRLVTSTRGGITQENRYDAHGLRVRSESGSESTWMDAPFTTRTWFVYGQAGTLLHEHDPNTGERRDHVQLAGRTIATVARHDDVDSDGDGVPDWFERRHGLLAHDGSDGADDADGDGVTNLAEYVRGSMPSRRDTDGDGTEDGLDSDYSPLPGDGSGGGPDEGDGQGAPRTLDDSPPNDIPAAWIPLD